MFFNISRHLFLLIFAYFAFINFAFSQLTTPQNISGTFGLQLNSYPQQAPYSPQTTSNYYDQQYPTTQTDHYGYPSPEQLAQIPAPPLRQQQQFTNPYSSSLSADWRGQQSTLDAWRNAQYRAQYQQQYPGPTPSLNPEHSITNNNNLPYSQQMGNNDHAYATQLANRMYAQQGARQQYQQQGQYSLYGQQNYGSEQIGGNIGLQQLMPNREQIYGQQQHQQYGSAQTQLNPQYQSPTSRIVFPGNNRQQDEQNRHSFWFNSAIRIHFDATICLALIPLLIAFLL